MELLNIPSAWKGNEILNSQYWNYQLSREEIAEIEAAIHAIQLDRSQPLKFDRLKKVFEGISEELENGKGAVLLKGIPVDRYSTEEIADVYMALCEQMGTLVRQSHSDFNSDSASRKRSQFVGYVRAETSGTSKEGKQSNDPYQFHTDRADAISLLCIRQAREGGESRLASATAIYNEIIQTHPDIARELFKDMPWIYEGEKGWMSYPLWHIHQGKFTTQYSTAYVHLSQFVSGAPKLTQKQKEGIDLLQETGLKVGIEFKLNPGDWLIANNHTVYHARSSWEMELGESDRFLLRIWYSPFNSRGLPDTPTFRTMWASVEPGKPRGGFLPSYHVPPDREITEPLSEKDAYWLNQFQKGRWVGIK